MDRCAFLLSSYSRGPGTCVTGGKHAITPTVSLHVSFMLLSLRSLPWVPPFQILPRPMCQWEILGTVPHARVTARLKRCAPRNGIPLCSICRLLVSSLSGTCPVSMAPSWRLHLKCCTQRATTTKSDALDDWTGQCLQTSHGPSDMVKCIEQRNTKRTGLRLRVIFHPCTFEWQAKQNKWMGSNLIMPPHQGHQTSTSVISTDSKNLGASQSTIRPQSITETYLGGNL